MPVNQPILLVGSIPGGDAESVFRACGPALGEHVIAIPDGEAGTRERIAQAKAILPQFSIATECGFGRRPQEQIPELLDIHCRVLDAL